MQKQINVKNYIYKLTNKWIRGEIVHLLAKFKKLKR